MTLENFVRYLEKQHEHRPLYLFDQKYAQNAKDMLNDYKIPAYFSEDLFALAEEERPPFRFEFRLCSITILQHSPPPFLPLSLSNLAIRTMKHFFLDRECFSTNSHYNSCIVRNFDGSGGF
jgi:hypothetical protein